MRILSSLTNRIFLGSAALAVLTIAVAVYRFNVAVTAQAENELRRGLEEAGTLLEENRDTLFAHFSREARLIADLSNLKAAMDDEGPADGAADRRRVPAAHRVRPAGRHRPDGDTCSRRRAACACRTDRQRTRR